MKVNLTDYINNFAVFSPNFDAAANPMAKARNCYQSTKNFLASLDKYSVNFPELKEIKTILADLNEFFADMLLEQTNGVIKLAEEANLQVAKSRNKLGHPLAKGIIDNADAFIASIEKWLEEVTKQIDQSKQATLDEKKKLDDVDLNLLANSFISLGFQDRFFGGAVNINAKTHRSNASLFANGDFKNLASPTVKIEGHDELLKIAAMFQQFINKTTDVDNQFGFTLEEARSYTPG